MDIRAVTGDDGKQFAELLLSLDNETKFMMYEPGERDITEEMMCNRIEGMINSGSISFGAFDVDKMIGFAMLMRGHANRILHSGYIVVGVLKEASGKGIGSKLMMKTEEWATENQITRLELTVMTHNERAYELYLRQGFVNEGIKKNSLIVDGNYVDEYYMGKILI